MNEVARHRAINEFMEVVSGQRDAESTKSHLNDHDLSSQMMSMIYESGVSGQEITQPYDLKQEDEISRNEIV